MLTVNWITQVLANRTQYVCVNDFKSSIATVSSDIIQGNILGPALFVLHVNDIPSVCHTCRVKLYADDVKVYKVIKSSNDRILLQIVLNAIDIWSCQ